MAQFSSRKRSTVAIMITTLMAIGLYGIIPQFANFSNSLTTLQSADLRTLFLAVIVSFLTYIAAAQIYCWLSVKRLSFGPTLLVQLAGLLINRIFPAGIGGLGLNYAYLRTNRHTTVQAASVVALNSVIGFGGHILLLLLVVLVQPTVVGNLTLPRMNPTLVLICAIALMVGFLTLLVSVRKPQRAERLLPFKKALHSVIDRYKQQPGYLLAALVGAMILTACNVTSLWLCCQAVGISVGLLTVFIVFSAGVLVGTATPTPGGIGGFEAGLVAGLVAAHVDAPTALAAALLYRLITFWFGLLLGGMAFAVMQSRRIVRW